ncbi:MAG: hypothetical protein KJ749_14900 [Planctomycetes bacterium]|nr:hypothetical protein [Planctomycetota bacterium]
MNATACRLRSLAAAISVVVLAFHAGCAVGPGGQAAPSSGRTGSVFHPRGTPWTIRCLELRGPHRLRQIEQIAETLRRTAGIDPSRVSVADDSDGVARLYYGTYYRRTDRKTGKRSTPRELSNDLKLIRELGTGPGEYYFIAAVPVRMPTPNVGDPAWDLRKADGVYTLQVGIFESTDEFWEYKQAAVEFCKLLRERGYQAYYYHTDAASTVTVGTFGEDAVIPNPRGLPSYSREVIALQQQDDLLKYNHLNGAIYRARTDKGGTLRVPSRLVRIPQPEAAPPW